MCNITCCNKSVKRHFGFVKYSSTLTSVLVKLCRGVRNHAHWLDLVTCDTLAHTYYWFLFRRLSVALQVAQLWQRDRASSINDFRWGGQFDSIIDWVLLFAPLRHDAIYAHASYGKRTISSTRPSYWIQISTPSTLMREQHSGRPSDVYNTDRPTKLTALLRRSAVDLYSKVKKIVLWATFKGTWG